MKGVGWINVRLRSPDDRLGLSPADRGQKRSADRTDSFLLHVRPRSYPAAAVAFSHTYYLGFLAVFFLVLEGVTGVALLIYYQPSPDQAYGSILRLLTEVPCGSLLRDLHRLGGECLLVVALLHLIRVFATGAYRGKRALTWLTGIVLLLCSLALAFTGYLLPWDQLAYWAVTIGISLVTTIPVVGEQVGLLLRGGAEIGMDGLLRFYVLHIMVIPLIMGLCMAIHYYRVARVHGISRPRTDVAAGTDGQKRAVVLLPQQALMEIIVSALLLLVLVGVAGTVYDAPLEGHANPGLTPLNTQAPWFFLWIQGALKLGDAFLFGVCLPLAFLALLAVLPLIDSNGGSPFGTRPPGRMLLVAALCTMAALSLWGRADHRRQANPVTQMLEGYLDADGDGRLEQLVFSMLEPGIYLGAADSGTVPAALRLVLDDFFREVKQLPVDGAAEHPQGVVAIEDWQADLKRITLRVRYKGVINNDRSMTSSESMRFLHRNNVSRMPSAGTAAR